jgi:CHAT domain-containing protein/Tfp pilus assembly protein PilF
LSTHRRPRSPAAPRPLPALVLALATAACAGDDTGLVVTRCEPWGAGGRAGIEAGDRLLAWRAGEDAGTLASPLELFLLEVERGPAEAVELTIARGRRQRAVRVEGSIWALETRPAAAPAEPPDRASEEAVGAALDALRERAAEAEATATPVLAAWWRLAEGDLLVGAERFDDGAAAYASARRLVAEPRHQAGVDEWQTRHWIAAARFDDAQAAARRALTVRQMLDPEGPAVAASLHQLGRIDQRRQAYGEEGGLERAEATFARMPYGAELAAAVGNIRGVMAWARRDLDLAESRFRAAESLLAERGYESPERARALNNQGLIAELRGDMGRAEELFRDAAGMYDRVDPGSDGVAYSYNYLGVLARQKGDLATAQRYYERALAAFETAKPESVETAGMFNNLGNLAFERGELGAAERFHRRALAVREKVAPETIDHAASLQNVGKALQVQGEPDDAEPYLLRAREIKARLVPGSDLYANALTALGRLRRDQGRLVEAEALHREALAARRATAGGRWEWAESLFLLGEIALERGARDEAERLWREAVDGIEENRARAEWDPEERSAFAAPFHRYYRRLAALLVEDGRPREAFELLEGARARALRGLLAARTLGSPAELSVERSARSALLEEPRSPRLEEVTAALGAGAVLLAYSVDAEATLLFVVGGGDSATPTVHRIPAGARDLRSRVEIFRALIERGREGGAPEPALVAQGRWLYETLLAPAQGALAVAERVVIVPDGPLLALPFAALVRDAGREVEWLGGWRPLSLVPSAGVLVELDQPGEEAEPRESGRGRFPLVAFGDPRYADGRAAERTAGLVPLPATRTEVSRIAGLFPGSLAYLGAEATEDRLDALPGRPSILHLAVHGLLDERFPLESALAFSAPAAGPGRRDGLRDGPHDGLLHAWEVAERLDLEADLVVLSACDSGRGRELAGEGIVGMARAFQVAGARSVLVSQWPVADRSTAELMVRFYRHLATGLPKAGALAAAQYEMAEGQAAAMADGVLDPRHPFAWAGFQIVGDGG